MNKEPTRQNVSLGEEFQFCVDVCVCVSVYSCTNLFCVHIVSPIYLSCAFILAARLSVLTDCF